MCVNNKLSIREGLDAGVKHFVDECILCGKCVEGCPVFLEPKFELVNKGPEAAIEKVIDLLKGGQPSKEAYKLVYGCMNCSHVCKLACPKGLDLRSALISAGHRLQEAGEGLPPLAYQHALGHRYGFGQVFGDLQIKKNEVPWLKEAPPTPEAVDVVLFISCTAQGMPHLALEAMDILKKMGVNFAAIGARDLCCGGITLSHGTPEELSRVSEHYITTMAKFGAKKVVSLCPGCALLGSAFLPAFFSVPFESMHITDFLADNLDKLPFTQPLNKVVTIHDACAQRQLGRWEVPRKLLRAIPGVTLVEMEHNRENNLCCGAVANLNFPGSMDARYYARLNEAQAVGADVLTSICTGCQLVFCPLETQYPFEIKHAISLVAEAMGIHHEDKLKKYLLMGDPDKVLDEAREYVEASDLSLFEFQQVLPDYFKAFCVSRGSDFR